MATFYLDFENGNDSNDGSSWAQAWKTIHDGATAARIAPGDVIRVAKTADPVSIGNATWTSKSNEVTLATAQTEALYMEGAWTGANSSTVTTSTTRLQGSNSASIRTASSTATNTKYAYYTIGGGSGVDLSSYDAITFSLYTSSWANTLDNMLVIKLCSDTTGDTAVDEFIIPASPASNKWVNYTLTRTGGGALGSSIQSIAFYTGSSNPGNSRTSFIDQVSACDADGLNLKSLISKNSSGGYSSTETWHGIQSINGTEVILANRYGLTAGSSSLKGYWTSGTSPETVTTYIRKTYSFGSLSSFSTVPQPFRESGTAGNLITYSGGWDTSTTTQDGMTWISADNYNGRAFNFVGFSYIKIERFGISNFSSGTFSDTTGLYCEIDSCIVNNCNDFSLPSVSTINMIGNNCQNASLGNLNYSSIISNIKFYNFSSTVSMQRTSKINSLEVRNSTALSLQYGIINNLIFTDNNSAVGNQSTHLTIIDATISNNTGSATLNVGGSMVINKLTASGNTNLGRTTGKLYVKQTNAASTQLLGSSEGEANEGQQYLTAHYNAVNNDVNDNRAFWLYGNALSQTTERNTPSGLAWQINITNSAQTSDFPIYFPIAKVACNASSLVTVKAWVKLSHATDIGAKLFIEKNEIPGVTADVTATKTADTNWEELTITFTPTVAGVVQVYLQGYWLANTADESIYVDDVTVTQA